ncbi:MAG: tRNA (N6-isopentenyl adenosine(37)-C2)-methylthiotransferase MiaB [Rhodospirillaceae bacterium]|nr:tRNA (N6-isopentenyl adenosine(37)-C2)-methylthiotransferase MiaB [Rhodospirillaceae bacterium]MBL6931504.1 tRNA (N6-isopentenyl adenosine(37)-C2)-methylthiotransferase MiaB [Rhodospirillales bacterium]
MTKKLHIKTYGCQMNVYDSARMTDVLLPLGYSVTDNPDDADMVILNTCHIREKAAEKVYSELGRLNRIKARRNEQGSDMILAVAGCVAQAEGEEMMRRAPFVDLVFGPQTYHALPEMIARVSRAGGAVLNTDFPDEAKFDHLPEVSGDSDTIDGASAFLTVQEGCDKFCAFCVVPYTRGSEYSRPAADILNEARRLVDLGVKELTLLGQNVNSYHGIAADDEEWGLGRLIQATGEIAGIERIRYTTSYPADVDADLIAAHRDVKQLMPFLHLPVQSGSDRILKAMNRRHGADDYRQLVQRLRTARPDIALSSDFIVGFPGESDADFEGTMTLVREIGFIQAYSFKYSPRPGTPAASLDNQIDEQLKSQRLKILQDELNSQQRAFNESCVGRTMPVLLDRSGRHSGQMVGRSPYMQPVHVTAPEELFGSIVDLHIDAAQANSLAGSLNNSTSNPTNKENENAA